MKTIKFDDLVRMIEPGRNHPILIDTLPRESFLKEHIPGSINLPADRIAQEAPKLFGQHDWIVVYCANEACDASHEAAEALEKKGFTHVIRYAGGLQDWKDRNKYFCSETRVSSQKKLRRYPKAAE